MTRKKVRFLLLVGLGALLFVACTRPRLDPAEFNALLAEPLPHSLSLMWSLEFDELMTDLQFSPDGTKILASFIPHPEGGGRRRPIARLFEVDGKLVWERETGVSVKAMALSNQQAVLVNFDDEALRFPFSALPLPAATGHCRPIYLKVGNWFCLNDDAIKSGPAVWRISNKKLIPLEKNGDVLTHSISPSFEHAVVALAGGGVKLLARDSNSSFRSYSLSGEPLLSAASDREWAVLFKQGKEFLIASGGWKSDQQPLVRGVQLTADPRQLSWLGEGLVVGEWSQERQKVSLFRASSRSWDREVERDLELKPEAWMPFRQAGDSIAMMVVTENDQSRRSRLIGLGLGLRPTFMVESGAGHHDLFQNFAVSPDGRRVATISDSGLFKVFSR